MEKYNRSFKCNLLIIHLYERQFSQTFTLKNINESHNPFTLSLQSSCITETSSAQALINFTLLSGYPRFHNIYTLSDHCTKLDQSWTSAKSKQVYPIFCNSIYLDGIPILFIGAVLVGKIRHDPFS